MGQSGPRTADGVTRLGDGGSRRSGRRRDGAILAFNFDIPYIRPLGPIMRIDVTYLINFIKIWGAFTHSVPGRYLAVKVAVN